MEENLNVRSCHSCWADGRRVWGEGVRRCGVTHHRVTYRRTPPPLWLGANVLTFK